MLLLLSVSFQFLFFVLFYVFFLIATPYYDTKSLLVNCRLALHCWEMLYDRLICFFFFFFFFFFFVLLAHLSSTPIQHCATSHCVITLLSRLSCFLDCLNANTFLHHRTLVYLSDIHDYSRVVRIHRFSQFFPSLFSSPFLFRTRERSLIPSPSSSPERRLISEPTRGLDKLHGNQKPKLSVPRGPRLGPFPPCFFDPRSTRTNPLVTFHLDRSRANQPLIILFSFSETRFLCKMNIIYTRFFLFFNFTDRSKKTLCYLSFVERPSFLSLFANEMPKRERKLYQSGICYIRKMGKLYNS